MKVRMSVTVEIDDPYVYPQDLQGNLIEDEPIDRTERADVAAYVLDAVSYWGGQYAPSDPFFPSNIKRVKVEGIGFYMDSDD